MYLNSSINKTDTITAPAAAALSGKEFLAAVFSSGEIAVAGDGVNALGLILPEYGTVADGDDVVVQIKECGLWKTGAAVAAGAELASDANGKCITAAAGKYIVAIALEAASAGDKVIKVQIVKGGYKPAS